MYYTIKCKRMYANSKLINKLCVFDSILNLHVILGTLTFSVDNEIYGTIPISNYRDFSEEVTKTNIHLSVIKTFRFSCI